MTIDVTPQRSGSPEDVASLDFSLNLQGRRRSDLEGVSIEGNVRHQLSVMMIGPVKSPCGINGQRA